MNEPIWIFIALLFMPLNYLMEYLKWKSTLRAIGVKADQSTQWNSFMAGVVTGMLTPNMIGNFLGRMLYFQRRYRVGIVLFTMMANFAQFMATAIFGCLALIVAGEIFGIEGYYSISLLAIIVLICTILGYYFIEHPIKIIFKRKGYMKTFAADLSKSGWFRTTILFHSCVRYMIFLIQFSLVFMAFGVPVSVNLILAVSQLYLISILIPSLFLGKLGVRETVGLILLGAVGVNEPAIIATSLTIWSINLVLPTLISLFIIKRYKDVV